VSNCTTTNTTYRYVNANINIDTARRAAAALDAFNSQAETASLKRTR